MSTPRLVAIGVLGLRIAYGAALLAAPGRVTRSWLGPAGGERPPPSPCGPRRPRGGDAAAAAVAAWRGHPVRPWLVLSIVGDLSDIAATAAGRRELPPKAAPATAVVAGASAAISAAVAAAVDC